MRTSRSHPDSYYSTMSKLVIGNTPNVYLSPLLRNSAGKIGSVSKYRLGGLALVAIEEMYSTLIDPDNVSLSALPDMPREFQDTVSLLTELQKSHNVESIYFRRREEADSYTEYVLIGVIGSTRCLLARFTRLGCTLQSVPGGGESRSDDAPSVDEPSLYSGFAIGKIHARARRKLTLYMDSTNDWVSVKMLKPHEATKNARLGCCSSSRRLHFFLVSKSRGGSYLSVCPVCDKSSAWCP